MIFSGPAIAEHHATEETVSQECGLPTTPIVPDGNVASEDELISAQKAMKGYQALLAEYRECLVAGEKKLDPDAEDTADRIKDNKAKYDASIDAEESIAEKFNTTVRAYKARQAPASE